MGDPVNVKLIELIRVRPCLYDPNHSESNSYHVKEHHWSDIGAELRINPSFLKKRWKVIRDRYRNEWNLLHKNPKGKSFWRHFKQLSFLEPHLTHRSAIAQRVHKVEVSQPTIPLNDYDEYSEYMEVLESEQEEYQSENITQQPTVLEQQDAIETVNNAQKMVITQPLDQGRLIEMVKAFPYLYDQFHSSFNDRNLKQATWEQIAVRLESTATDVRIRWNDLCDRFRREHKKVKSTGRAPYVSPFKYYDQLTFLATHSNRELKADITFSNEHSNEVDGGNDESYYENDEQANGTKKLFKPDDIDCRMIQFVRNNPVLYDKHHPDYDDSGFRIRKWARLSSEVGLDLNAVLGRWKTLLYEYELQSSSHQNGSKFVEMLSFLNKKHGTNVPNTEMNASKCAEEKIATPSVKTSGSVPQRKLTSPATRCSPTTTKPIVESSSSRNSYVKMFFDSIAAQIEAENLPFRYFAVIQQDVLKVVHEQIATYIDDQQ